MTAQVALITGAGGGLGRAVAAHLAEAGWRLALVSRSAARLEGVARPMRCASKPMFPRQTVHAPRSRSAPRRSRCRRR